MLAGTARTVGGGALFAVAVLAYAAFAWVSIERRVLDAAEAEGRALLGAVAAGIESSLDASRAAEGLLAERLFEQARRLEIELAAAPGREQEVLTAFARSSGLQGVVLLDGRMEVVASATGADQAAALSGGDGPFARTRLKRLEATSLARRVADAGLQDAGRVVLGFGGNPFGTREFLVGARVRGGFVLLRLDAAELATFEAEAGVHRLLADAGAAEGIGYLMLQSEDGAILAADTEAHAALGLPPPGDERGWRRAEVDGRHLLDVALPAPWEGPPSGYLRAGLDAAPVEQLLARSRRDLAVFTGLILLLGIGGLTFLSSRARRAARREADLQRELDDRERFASLGRLAGGIAHEVRSPLNALSMAAQRLSREAAPSHEPERTRFHALTQVLSRSVERLDDSVRDFLRLGQRDPPDRLESVDVAILVAQVGAEELGSIVLHAPATPLVIQADGKALARAVANLVRNAHQAAPDGTVDVRWRTVDGAAEVSIEDRGPGIAAADRARIFEPFFTGRQNGTGLGLTLAKDAVERHGGTLWAEPREGGGTRFVLRIPTEGEGS
jgi:signal transduction histidine kinase